MVSVRLLTVFLIVIFAGCSDEPETVTPEPLSAASLPGVYSGVFPCDGCPGIATTLWLRADGRFFFEQRYPGDDAQEDIEAHSLGRWRRAAESREIELVGAGPSRSFRRLDQDTLVMLTDSELEHRLTRDPSEPALSASIRMAGIVRTREGSVYFTECLTGLAAPVSRGGDFERFRHQYRSAGGRGKPVYVELEGRFSWSADGAPRSLTIERFVTAKRDTTC